MRNRSRQRQRMTTKQALESFVLQYLSQRTDNTSPCACVNSHDQLNSDKNIERKVIKVGQETYQRVDDNPRYVSGIEFLRDPMVQQMFSPEGWGKANAIALQTGPRGLTTPPAIPPASADLIQ